MSDIRVGSSDSYSLDPDLLLPPVLLTLDQFFQGVLQFLHIICLLPFSPLLVNQAQTHIGSQL